jgi:L-amino acid N-acyltransferase
MQIRDAVPADLPAILAIYNDVVANSTAIYSVAPSTLEERRAWFDARRASGFPVLVCASGAEVLGYSSFGEWRGAWAGYRHTVEHSVHVRADRRGAGLGQRLVEALFPLAAAKGMHVMIGAIDAANDGSIRFHKRLGFAEAGHFREVGRKFDRWLDLVFMQRFLDAPGAPRV